MFSAPHPRHRLIAGILLAYLVALAAVVFWPTPVDRNSGRFLTAALAWLHSHGVPAWFDYALVEWLSNVVMFLPFGFILAVMLPRSCWWAPTLIGLGTSIAIESTQLLFLDQRTASLLDVAANTLGAAAGAGCFILFERIRFKTR
ncbi:VanZ family protein [Paeniglutamicibacter cryotolerans]|uniref:Glycopeptide antibiotics resistance protein n=1 Tax=Paeniglutamicibacter cryotolerans TaxID=670079 RepID=A0A839QN08_9MICC|nr:VanZ family protein [Paeniglutamicibacter cryotolerans]MBB2996005.1 glycopeptide antibiotics resistance protein [Paeniglutamicibacter cryotolerans]